MHNRLFVFDIETIPDDALAERLTGKPAATVAERRALLQAYHLDITDGKSDFLRQPFHKVVAISFLEAHIERIDGYEEYTLTDIRSGGMMDASEKELLKGFFAHVDKVKPRLVSFNGRTFDLPVLKLRAMKHGIAAPFYHQAGDKWANYGSRYDTNWHCDLLEALSDFGAAARFRMHELCVAMGIPGKLGTDGGDVMAMYDAGQLAAIRQYCETDVASTFLLYLAYQHHRGVITTRHWHNIQDALRQKLQEESADNPSFTAFLAAWEAAAQG
jgi:predicted PolB exonuclease-like 3'-5' exonuclease